MSWWVGSEGDNAQGGSQTCTQAGWKSARGWAMPYLLMSSRPPGDPQGLGHVKARGGAGVIPGLLPENTPCPSLGPPSETCLEVGVEEVLP